MSMWSLGTLGPLSSQSQFRLELGKDACGHTSLRTDSRELPASHSVSWRPSPAEVGAPKTTHIRILHSRSKAEDQRGFKKPGFADRYVNVVFWAPVKGACADGPHRSWALACTRAWVGLLRS